jgi:NAD-dependent dihydropyrimidine dehydrogenase PreA subunit
MKEWRDPVPVASSREEAEPDEWTRRVTRVALEESEHVVELVGVASLNPDWVFEGHAVDAPWVVVLGVAMDFEQLATAPDPTAAVEVLRQYARGTYAARDLADWIRARGHQAEGHGGPEAGPLQMLPHALAAGFGELGKHGSIINRRLGSSFRLACVTTDLPLAPTPPDRFGADEFCFGCRVCTDACPPGAIGPDKVLVRGEVKWYVDFDRCLPYFAATHGCAVCLAVCPWSKPGAAPRLAANMTRKLSRT